jgi:hypothetical protein
MYADLSENQCKYGISENQVQKQDGYKCTDLCAWSWLISSNISSPSNGIPDYNSKQIMHIKFSYNKTNILHASKKHLCGQIATSSYPVSQTRGVWKYLSYLQ